MADYTQPDYVDRRLRYFDGQFLREQDFIDEQRYHLDRLRRLSRLLRTPGVLEGFEVSPVANAPRVKVGRGTAIDGNGRLLVRADDSAPLDLADLVNRDGPVTVIVSAAYREVEADAPPGGASPRWQEDPLLSAALEATSGAAASDSPSDSAIRLARLTLGPGGGVTVGAGTSARLSGVHLPGPLSVDGRASFLGDVSGPPGAPLRVDGDLQVRGPTDFDSAVRLRLTNGSNDYGRTNLVLTGRIQDGNDAWTFGSAARNSIVFASNASPSGQNAGAPGDEQQSIQLEGNSAALGFLTRSRGGSPALVIAQDGAVGVGTTNPSASLHVDGEVLVSGGSALGQIGRWTATRQGGTISVAIGADSNHNIMLLGRVDGQPIDVVNIVVASGTIADWSGTFVGLANAQNALGEIGVFTYNFDGGTLFGNLAGHAMPSGAGRPIRVLVQVHRVHGV